MFAADGEDFSANQNNMSVPNNDKADRRNVIQRCISSTATCMSYCARPQTALSRTNKSTNKDFDKQKFSLDFYEDTYNDDPWDCTFGTSEYDGIWINCTDQVGNIMSVMVWVLQLLLLLLWLV